MRRPYEYDDDEHSNGARLSVQAIVDKMKTMSAELEVGVTAAGDLHLQVASGGLRLGTELRGLQAGPEDCVDPLKCVHAHVLFQMFRS